MRLTTILLSGALALAATAAGAVSDPVPLDSGRISGEPADENGVRAFKGIPFAAPPVGDLRWRPPQPVESWDGVREMTSYGNVCVQPPGEGRVNVSVDLPDSPPMSEDCLYLNVWTPAGSAGEDLPVMFWIFGGAYTEGAGSTPHNEGHTLAAKNVVVVTFNYRLGPFGFFSHPELTEESEHDASGNYALMDAIAALEWVQRNIEAFGGDPDNVSAFGESAGASILSGLVGSPEAEGLFHRAMVESAGWMGLGMGPMIPQQQAEKMGAKMASSAGAETVEDLRDLSTDEVSANLRGAGMVVDGWIVPEDLSITFAEGRQNAVDLLIGSTKDEGSWLPANTTAEQWKKQAKKQYGDLAEEFLKVYPGRQDWEAQQSALKTFSDQLAWHERLFAERQKAVADNVYLYYFTHNPPEVPGQPDQKAIHTAEIPYVFDNLGAPRVFPDGSSPAMAVQSREDQELADQVSAYWVNFARTGNPNGEGLDEWPPFEDLINGPAKILGPVPAPGEAPSPKQLELFNQLYERQVMSNLE